MIMIQIFLFSMPLNAQTKTPFSNSLVKQASMLRLPVKGSDRFIQITVLSKSVGAALIAFPGEDSRVVRGFKYLVSDGVLGFIGVLEQYWYKDQFFDNASIVVYISPEYGGYTVGYSVSKDDETLQESMFPLNGVKFYDALKSDKTPVFSVSSDKETYDAVLKWAKIKVNEYSE